MREERGPEESKTIDVLVQFDPETLNVKMRGPDNTLFCLGILEMAVQSMKELRNKPRENKTPDIISLPPGGYARA